MSALRSLVKAGASALDVIRPPAAGIVVLIYHRVGARTPTPVDLPLGLFADQMAYLADLGRVTTLDAAVELCQAGVTEEESRVVVTFDDGTADFADEAVPVMQHYDIPSTLYVATDFVERGVEFPDHGRPISWSALADCVSTGLVTVGSHTDTHVLLDRAAPEVVEQELDRSMDLIGARLGMTARHFAYPKALPGSRAADAAVRKRFSSAAVAGTRPNPYLGTDVYELARSPLQTADGMRFFRRKVAGGMRGEDTLRRLANRRRYATATS